jgi:ubiquinone/menaquinone biosynthesis C-methylase UbiE
VAPAVVVVLAVAWMSSPETIDAAYPSLVFETLTAYRRTAALVAAIELDVFTAIGEGAETVGALARRCDAAERGIRILCDCMVALDFLRKHDERYALTPTAAAFLDRRSRRYMGGMAGFLNSSAITAGFADVAAAVRRGGTVLGGEGTLAPEHPVWVDFARAMAARAALTAEPLIELLALSDDRPAKMLDVAAGHGLYGIAFLRRYRAMEVVAVDWPAVLESASRNAQDAGVAARFRTLPGDVFAVDLGRGYDLVLLANFLHHFDAPTCEVLLRRAHGTLAPGGRTAILDFVPDESRVSPPSVALFNVAMLATTPSGEAHTFAEYARMLANAGFARSELHPLGTTPHRVIVSYA